MEYWDCRPSSCGKVGEIDYPFWSENRRSRPHYCGRPEFKLHCPPDEEDDDYPFIHIDSQTFNVSQIDPSAYKMTLVRTNFVYDNCSSHLTNTSVSSPLNHFHYEEPYVNMSLFYDRSPDNSIGGIKFACQDRTSSYSNSNNYAFFSEYVLNQPQFAYLIKNCKHHIQVPVSSTETDVSAQALLGAVGKGFGVRYNVDESCRKCLDSGGKCGSNDPSPFVCYCRHGLHPLFCPHSSSGMHAPLHLLLPLFIIHYLAMLHLLM